MLRSPQGEFVCRGCKKSQPCSLTSQSVVCTSCRREFDFISCPACREPQTMRHSKNGVCRSCSAKLLISLKLPKVSFEDLMGRDPAAPSSSSILSNGEWPSFGLYRLTVLDWAGWCPRVGSVVQLHLYQERFDIGMNDGTLPLTSVNLDSMRDMRIEGRSVSTGGGLHWRWVWGEGRSRGYSCCHRTQRLDDKR